jgi:methionyl-tRNA formyltransferase
VSELPSYNIIFAGTPDFAVETLRALIHSRHTVQAVYTQPDRPAGRGRKLTASPVKQLALEHNVSVYQPQTLRDEREQAIITAMQADLMIVVAYGLILPNAVLQATRYGCINVHGSLLPKWRGAAPIQRSVLAGDSITGVTIMRMDQGLDTGDMLYKVESPIGLQDTSASLYERLAHMGSDALLHTLDNLTEIVPEKQNDALATYAHKIAKEEAVLEWEATALELNRKVRAFNPWPVAYTFLDGSVVRIWQTEVLAQQSATQKPGTIMHVSSEGIDVATSSGILRLQKIQLAGGRVLPVADVLNAHRADFAVGTLLG